MVFSRFGSGRQSSQLQAQKATLGSGTGASEAPLGPACHGGLPVSEAARQSRQLQASKASFLPTSESDVRHWHRGLGSAVGTGHAMVFFPFRKRPPKQSAAGSESDVRPVAPGLRKRRWDRHAMVCTRFGSSRQSRQLQASKASF